MGWRELRPTFEDWTGSRQQAPTAVKQAGGGCQLWHRQTGGLELEGIVCQGRLGLGINFNLDGAGGRNKPLRRVGRANTSGWRILAARRGTRFVSCSGDCRFPILFCESPYRTYIPR